MGIIKGKVEASIALNKATCYFMRTGRCSLHVVTDYYLAPSAPTAANDLLYCPRLYREMCGRGRMTPIGVTPCECGHAEVVTGHQRACIASQKQILLEVKPAGPGSKKDCPVCGGRIPCDENGETYRIVNLLIRMKEEKTE